MPDRDRDLHVELYVSVTNREIEDAQQGDEDYEETVRRVVALKVAQREDCEIDPEIAADRAREMVRDDLDQNSDHGASEAFVLRVELTTSEVGRAERDVEYQELS